MLAGMLIKPPGTVNSTPQTNQLNNGTIAGINYSYGTNTYSASGNYTHVEQGVVSEVYNQTTTVSQTMPLLTSITVADVQVLVYALVVGSDGAPYVNSTTTYANNATYYSDYVDFLFVTMALRFDGSNATHGQELMNVVYTENVTTAQTSLVTTTGDFLGQYPTAVSQIQYDYKFLNGTVVRHIDYLFNQIIYFDVTTQDFSVVSTTTNYAQSYVGYYVRYSNQYNITATAHQVNITDGQNFALGVSMFDSVEANYTEVLSSYIGYSFIGYQVTQLKFANGTDVPWEMYPRNLLPYSYSQQGSQIDVGFRISHTKLVSTFQNVAAVFAAYNENITDNAVSLSANLAIWNLQSVPTMVAFQDGNNNGRLDLSLSSAGLSVSSADRVNYLGVAEAYQSTTINGYYSSHVYNESLQLYGLGVNITNTNVNDTAWDIKPEVENFGDVNAATTSTFTWNEPVQNTDGSVTFDFGVDYNNFPVTWVNVTDPAHSIIDYESLGYHYIVNVDPNAGTAKISGTWMYGGVVNPTFKSIVSNLSLANIIKSDFLAISASYSATQSDVKLNSSRASQFTTVGVLVGGGVASQIGVDGPKQFYISNGVNHTANFDAISVLTVASSFSAERNTAFSSESENTAGTSTVNGIVEQFNANLFYSASLVVVSYPVWGGQNIQHDPDYKIKYEPNAEPASSNEPTTDNSPTSNAPTTTTTTAQPTTSEAPASAKAGLPFMSFMMIIPLLIIPIIYRKFKR